MMRLTSMLKLWLSLSWMTWHCSSSYRVQSRIEARGKQFQGNLSGKSNEGGSGLVELNATRDWKKSFILCGWFEDAEKFLGVRQGAEIFQDNEEKLYRVEDE